MNDRIEEDLPKNEAELLLPFYVNGTLGEKEQRLVEAWLSENAEAADHLARVDEELTLTRADAEMRGAPPRRVLDNLMAEIGAAPSGSGRVGLAERIWSMLSPRYALAGAAALCAVVALESGYLVYSGQQAPAQYQTATSGPEAFSGPSAMVVFASDAGMDAIAARLTDLDLTIIDGPKPGGVFIVGAPDSEDGKAALERLGKTEGLIQFFQLR